MTEEQGEQSEQVVEQTEQGEQSEQVVEQTEQVEHVYEPPHPTIKECIQLNKNKLYKKNDRRARRTT